MSASRYYAAAILIPGPMFGKWAIWSRESGQPIATAQNQREAEAAARAMECGAVA